MEFESEEELKKHEPKCAFRHQQYLLGKKWKNYK